MKNEELRCKHSSNVSGAFQTIKSLFCSLQAAVAPWFDDWNIILSMNKTLLKDIGAIACTLSIVRG